MYFNVLPGIGLQTDIKIILAEGNCITKNNMISKRRGEKETGSSQFSIFKN